MIVSGNKTWTPAGARPAPVPDRDGPQQRPELRVSVCGVSGEKPRVEVSFKWEVVRRRTDVPVWWCDRRPWAGQVSAGAPLVTRGGKAASQRLVLSSRTTQQALADAVTGKHLG